jgi:hypothetical protein
MLNFGSNHDLSAESEQVIERNRARAEASRRRLTALREQTAELVAHARECLPHRIEVESWKEERHESAGS